MATFTTTNKKSAAKPDMTPLVDLGFMLITFFIYTTSFNKPVIMPFAQPRNDDGTSPIMESNSLTLIIGENDRLFYHGETLNDLSTLIPVEVSKTGLRELLISSKYTAKSADAFTVIIKPSDLSTYDKFIDVLEEMVIVNQQHYAVVDLSEKEKSLLY